MDKNMRDYKGVMMERKNRRTERNAKIVTEYIKGGVTMAQLGKKHKISRQRVHQLLVGSSRLTQ
jgi:thiamine monophosphate synthase